jgi:hypothetical protein
MHAVVRSYSGQGVSELFEELEQRNDEVKDLIGEVPGFVSYTAIRSGEGGITVTVCQDKTGTDESSRRAAEWVKENISATANPPVITEGSTVVHIKSKIHPGGQGARMPKCCRMHPEEGRAID